MQKDLPFRVRQQDQCLKMPLARASSKPVSCNYLLFPIIFPHYFEMSHVQKPQQSGAHPEGSLHDFAFRHSYCFLPIHHFLLYHFYFDQPGKSLPYYNKYIILCIVYYTSVISFYNIISYTISIHIQYCVSCFIMHIVTK